ncbi:MAG TPA: iron-sulfur cluster assembly protein [Thermoprotei archaeon]|nr:iron-sulfur cluster assembly protein [Thermoprotei archaeon]
MSDLEKRIWDALREIMDPEIGLNIVDAGLVRDIKIEDGKVTVLFRPTSPFCPLMKYFAVMIRKRVEEVEGVKEVKVETVFP